MCGICGIFGRSGDIEPKADLEIMLGALRHRGTTQGLWAAEGIGLAARRLPIVDIEGSSQPIFNEKRNLVLVGNGEIYNFKDLKEDLQAKGHHFSTRGDLECILHLYEDLGNDLWPRLRGMFAVALFDLDQRTLVLARDHLGIKPLFFTATPKSFCFASEIKALRALSHCDTSLNPQALADFLALQFVPRPGTVFQEIQSLPPAAVLVLSASGMTVKKYWRLNVTSDGNGTPQPQAAEEVLSLLEGSVARRLMSDVPVGVLLSGGLDSSVIAALASRQTHGKISTFSIVFKEKTFDESEYSRLVAAGLGTDHHEVVLNDQLILDSMEAIQAQLDEPFCEGSAFPIYHICKYAKDHVTVILSGEGADEIFGGYETYTGQEAARYYRRLPRFVRSIFPLMVQRLPVSDHKTSLDMKLRRFVDGIRFDPPLAHFWWRATINDEQKKTILHPDFMASLPRLECAPLYLETFGSLDSNDTLNKILATDCQIHLVDDLLLRADLMSMAHTMELRVPFLDLDLVEHAFSIPSAHKIRGWTTKNPLRQAAKGLLPERIRKRPKMGLNMPYQKWFKTKGFGDLLQDCLSPSSLAPLGVFDPAGVQNMLEAHQKGLNNHAHALWAIMNLVLWMKRNG